MFKGHKHMVYIHHSCRNCYWMFAFNLIPVGIVPNRFIIWRDPCLNKYYLWTLKGWKEHGTDLILCKDCLWTDLILCRDCLWTDLILCRDCWWTDLMLCRECLWTDLILCRDCLWTDLILCRDCLWTDLILWRDWLNMEQIWSSVWMERTWNRPDPLEGLLLDKCQQWIRMRRDCSWKDLNIC